MRHEDGDRFGIFVSVEDGERIGYTRFATHAKSTDLDRELHRLIQFELKSQAANLLQSPS